MKYSKRVIVLCSWIVITGCVGGSGEQGSEGPRIVEVFACSDYCPGPEEQYMKRVYEGVTDEKACRQLGGRLFTYIGWGEHTVCEVR